MIELPKLHWIRSPNFTKGRSGSNVRLIVIHDTEGGFGGACSWFANPASQVSAHFVLREDGTEAVQMVHLDDKAWHVKAFNRVSIGIEMAGFSKKGFSDAEWHECAEMTAFLLKEFGLPKRWADKGEGAGFCSHYQLGVAAGGHSDPTTDSGVWQHFVDRVMAVDFGQLPDKWEFADPGRPALDHSNMSDD